MAFNIHDFKANGLQFGGARPTLFSVNLTIPPALTLGGDSARDMSFVIKASSIPNAPMESVDVFYFGRAIKLNGDRIFPDWEITVLNDEDFGVRRQLENWSNMINTHVGNLQTQPAYDALGYKSTATVTQFGKGGATIAAYQFEGLWPKMVEPMAMDWADTNKIQEFRCTFAYDLWLPVAGDTTSKVDATPGTVAANFLGDE